MNPLMQKLAEDPACSDEQLWAGDYGIHYSTRFQVDYSHRKPLLIDILRRTEAKSVLDVGTNLGWNLRAIRELGLGVQLCGVDVNEWAAAACGVMGFETYLGSARSVGEMWPGRFDLVMTSGVLIHVPPELLEETMRSIAAASKRWVLAIEYIAPEEIVKVRHGEVARCWARPYDALYEKLGLTVADFGVATGYTDCTYWLMEKR